MSHPRVKMRHGRCGIGAAGQFRPQSGVRTVCFDLVRRLGIRVVQVDEDLPLPVLYSREHSLAFVSSGLDRQGEEDAADWLLSAACSPAPVHRT